MRGGRDLLRTLAARLKLGTKKIGRNEVGFKVHMKLDQLGMEDGYDVEVTEIKRGSETSVGVSPSTPRVGEIAIDVHTHPRKPMRWKGDESVDPAWLAQDQQAGATSHSFSVQDIRVAVETGVNHMVVVGSDRIYIADLRSTGEVTRHLSNNQIGDALSGLTHAYIGHMNAKVAAEKGRWMTPSELRVARVRAQRLAGEHLGIRFHDIDAREGMSGVRRVLREHIDSKPDTFNPEANLRSIARAIEDDALMLAYKGALPEKYARSEHHKTAGPGLHKTGSMLTRDGRWVEASMSAARDEVRWAYRPSTPSDPERARVSAEEWSYAAPKAEELDYEASGELFMGTPPDLDGQGVASGSEVVAAIRRLFNIPIKVMTKKHGAGARAAGVTVEFEGRLGEIASATDVGGAAWVVGAALEPHFTALVANHPNSSTLIGELTALGKSVYGSTPPWNGYETVGMYEAVRLWLTDPDALKLGAPSINKWMDSAIEFDAPNWKKRLKEVRKLATDRREAGAEKRVRAFRQEAKRKIDYSSFAQQWIDKGAPILKLMQNLSKAGFTPDPMDPDALADPGLTREALIGIEAGRVKKMVTDGMVDLTGQPTGAPSLLDAYRLAGGTDESWANVVDYLVAKQGISIKANGKEPGMSLLDMYEVTAKYENDPAVQAAANAVWSWNEGILDYMVQAGALTPGEKIAMQKTYPFYVPFQRAHPRVVGMMKDAGVNLPRRPMRMKTGSKMEIIDPVEAMVSQAVMWVRWAHERAVQNRLAALSEAVPDLGKVISRVDDADIPNDPVIESMRTEIASEMKRMGLSPDDMAGSGVANLSKFIKQNAYDNGRGDVVFKAIDSNGKERWYRVRQDFWTATQSQELWHFGVMADLLLAAPARTKRLGTTGLSVGFAGLNIVRDFIVGALNEMGSNPIMWVFDYVRSMGDGLKTALGGEGSEFWKLYQDIEMSSQLNLDTANTKKGRLAGSLKEELFRQDFPAGNLLQHLKKPVGHGLRGAAALARGRLPTAGGEIIRGIQSVVTTARDLVGFSEAFARVTGMRRAAAKLKIDMTQPLTLQNSMRLLREGRQITVDFNSGGQFARQLNQILPFFNAWIQGPRRVLGRNLKKGRLARTGAYMGSMVAMTYMLWDQNKDKDWYNDLPYWERAAFWHFDNGLRIPKPFEVGYVVSIAEGLFHASYKNDKREWKEMVARSASTMAPGDFMGFVPIPVLAQAGVEWHSARNMFLDRDSVPLYLRQLDPEDQFGPSTTKTAQVIGSLVKAIDGIFSDDPRGASPQKIDQAISTIFGSLGRDLAALPGTVSGDPTGAEEAPGTGIRLLDKYLVGQVTKRFTRSKASQTVTDFYEVRQRLREKAGIRPERGQPNPVDVHLYRLFNSAASKMKLMREQMAGKSPTEKAKWRKLQAELAGQILEAAAKLGR